MEEMEEIKKRAKMMGHSLSQAINYMKK